MGEEKRERGQVEGRERGERQNFTTIAVTRY
jgi:hypothetical protein